MAIKISFVVNIERVYQGQAPKQGHLPPHYLWGHCGLSLARSIGPVEYVSTSKSQDFGLPFLISNSLTGRCPMMVEQQWLMVFPAFVQWVTSCPQIVSKPSQWLSSCNQSYLSTPNLLLHLQQKDSVGNSMQEQPSLAQVTQQGMPSLVKLVSGSTHISSAWGLWCSYLAALVCQSQKQVKFHLMAGLSLSMVALTVKRGLPPQQGGRWVRTPSNRIGSIVSIILIDQNYQTRPYDIIFTVI